MIDTGESARPKKVMAQGGPVQLEARDGGNGKGERRPEGANVGDERDKKVRR